jgi:hypothetical protein
MQFIILDESPEVSYNHMPAYMRSVNIREGWQILSDIGHIYGVTWETQNKCYSKSHSVTRSYCYNREAFERFFKHYEYFITASKNKKYIYKLYSCSNQISELFYLIPENRTPGQFAAQYLLDTKIYNKNGKQQISDAEIEKLKELL